MPTQPQWNIYEAAILLRAYIETLQGAISLQEAIRRVSMELRQMASNNGIEIDEVFRNINGIAFQIKSMESAYRGFTVMKPASRLFTEVVSIYRNDPERYKELLKEAREMKEPKMVSHENDLPDMIKTMKVEASIISTPTVDQREALTNWMTQNGMADASIRSYMSAIKKSSEYAADHGLLDTNIFSFTKAADVQSLRTKLMTDTGFEQLNVQQHNRFSAALAKYEQFFSTSERQTIDSNYEAKYPTLYRRLMSASKVYIDPDGLSIPRIKETIGYND